MFGNWAEGQMNKKLVKTVLVSLIPGALGGKPKLLDLSKPALVLETMWFDDGLKDKPKPEL
jgi:hypothetical protein